MTWTQWPAEAVRPQRRDRRRVGRDGWHPPDGFDGTGNATDGADDARADAQFGVKFRTSSNGGMRSSCAATADEQQPASELTDAHVLPPKRRLFYCEACFLILLPHIGGAASFGLRNLTGI
jgi:hypothetical protein